MSVLSSKSNLIHELFVRTADENYITARWCAIQRLNTDFLWLAVHALEKYLKAALLANGRSSIRPASGPGRFGHDIVRLYDEVKGFAVPLLPTRLTKPANLKAPYWFDRTPEEFLEHLLRNGNADNRYLIYGYATQFTDLHMLDAMVFAVRRLICSLDERWLSIPDPEAPTFTNRDMLTRQPEYRRRMSMPLDKLIDSQVETPKRVAALNLNMAFAPSDYLHESLPAGSSSLNPVIMRHVLEPLESDSLDWAAEGIEVAQWLLANVQVPRGKPHDPGVVEQIDAAIESAKAKHGI